MAQTLEGDGGGLAGPDEETERRRNERSAIEFPYGDLDGAVSLARTLYQSAGTSAEHEQLAAQLGVVASAGAYRARLAPARMFGLIQVERGRVSLTEDGEAVVDAATESFARVEAFLRVQLYSALYEKFKGKPLPPVKGLENEIVKLGVPIKQADRARQVFERSAEQAGFMAFGKDRLVRPNTERPSPAVDERQNNTTENESRGTQRISSDKNYLFLLPLLDRIPPQDTKWDHKERVRWLLAAAQLFDVVYKSETEEIISIKRLRETDDA